MTVTYAKDHNSTLLLVLPRYHKWIMRLWVSLGHSVSLSKHECCKAQGSMKGIQADDVCLEDMGGLLAGFTPWHSQLSMKICPLFLNLLWSLGLQTSPQHVPLPRVLRPHREGHTFWHQITGRTRWSYFVPVTVLYAAHWVGTSKSIFSKHHRTTLCKPLPTWIYYCLHLYLRSVTLGREGSLHTICAAAQSLTIHHNSEIRARKSRLSPHCIVLAEPVKASRDPIRFNQKISKETFDMVAKDD